MKVMHIFGVKEMCICIVVRCYWFCRYVKCGINYLLIHNLSDRRILGRARKKNGE